MKKIAIVCVVASFSVYNLFATNFPVEFIKLTDKITIHRSYEMYNGIKTPSNGLIIENDNSVLLIDTAWNDDETQQIVEYVKNTINKTIKSIIITHFHSDRAGGIKAINPKNINIYMTTETAELLHTNIPYQRITYGEQTITGLNIDIEYFGPAHTKDNIVVYLPNEKILFGGCIIKSIDSTSIGNTSDADVKNWPNLIKTIIQKYKNAKVIIPGHGEAGNYTLLTHTLDLLK